MNKKVLLSALMILAAVSAMSQTRLGIRGGLNLANVTIDKSGNTDESKMLPSFNAGLFADVPLAVGFALEPGLMLTGKGSKVHTSSSVLNTDMETRLNPLYLEVPLNFVGKVPLGNDTHLLLGAGPYAAFGIGGKVRTVGTFLGQDVDDKSDIKWDDDTPFNEDDKNQGWDKLKRFDYGANFLAGFQFGNAMVTANYGLGLAKINSGGDNDADQKNKNRVFSISLGFLLGGR